MEISKKTDAFIFSKFFGLLNFKMRIVDRIFSLCYIIKHEFMIYSCTRMGKRLREREEGRGKRVWGKREGDEVNRKKI